MSLFTGLAKNRHNCRTLIQHTNTDVDRQDFIVSSSSTSSDICNLTISQLIEKRTDQEEKDFQFALKLQKEFDLASKKVAEIDRKKGTVDGYLLRTISQSEKEESCSDPHSWSWKIITVEDKINFLLLVTDNVFKLSCS